MDRELFDLAQVLREQRDPIRNPGRASPGPLLLSGLVKCGRCGATYMLETSGKQSETGEYTYRYYNCRVALRSGVEACRGFRIPATTLERAVLEHVADRLFTVERCRALLKDLVEESGVLRSKSVEQLKTVNKELETVEKAIRRWEDSFEKGEVPVSLGIDRLQALKQRREELLEARRAVVVPRHPPAHLYSDANIARFQEQVREVFLSDEHLVTKNYLRFLVKEIVLNDGHVEIRAKPDAALRLMAEGIGKTKGVGVKSISPTPVVEWLPESYARRTGQALVLRMEEAWDWSALGLVRTNKRQLRSLIPPPNPVERGLIYDGAMRAGERLSYADVAIRFGVTRIEVCHYVTIVWRLPPDLVERVRLERNPRTLRKLSLRTLLRIARLDSAPQKSAAFRRATI